MAPRPQGADSAPYPPRFRLRPPVGRETTRRSRPVRSDQTGDSRTHPDRWKASEVRRRSNAHPIARRRAADIELRARDRRADEYVRITLWRVLGVIQLTGCVNELVYQDEELHAIPNHPSSARGVAGRFRRHEHKAFHDAIRTIAERATQDLGESVDACRAERLVDVHAQSPRPCSAAGDVDLNIRARIGIRIWRRRALHERHAQTLGSREPIELGDRLGENRRPEAPNEGSRWKHRQLVGIADRILPSTCHGNLALDVTATPRDRRPM